MSRPSNDHDWTDVLLMFLLLAFFCALFVDIYFGFNKS